MLLKIDYKKRQLGARADIKLIETTAKNAGALSAQLEVPVDRRWPSCKADKLIEQLEHKTPIAAVVTVKRLDLARFPFQQLGMSPPLTGGIVDGSVKLRGTLHEPIIDVDIEGRRLARGNLDKIDLVRRARLRQQAGATMKLDGSLRGQPIVRVRGEAPHRLPEGDRRHEPYGQTPHQGRREVPSYDLAHVQDLMPKVAGRFDAKAEVRGTIGHPTGKLDAAIAALNLGTTKFDKFVGARRLRR